MEFYTQKELLEYLGKNPNDRSLVQRMVIRGEIIKRDGVYILINKDRMITELEREVKELRHEIATMKESNWDLDEAKIQWEHYSRLYEEEKADKQERIRKCFRWIQTIKPRADWEEFRDWVMNDED